MSQNPDLSFVNQHLTALFLIENPVSPHTSIYDQGCTGLYVILQMMNQCQHWQLLCFCLSAELSGLLKTPLIPVGFSGKYPTKTGALKMPGIRGTCNFNFEKAIISPMSICLIRSYRNKILFTLLYLCRTECWVYEALGPQVSANQNDERHAFTTFPALT